MISTTAISLPSLQFLSEVELPTDANAQQAETLGLPIPRLVIYIYLLNPSWNLLNLVKG
jgi:hypothetical protein